MTNESDAQSFGSDHTAECGQKPGWISDTLRQFNFFAALRERNKTRRLCAAVLTLYRQLATEMPGSTAEERYSQVLARYSGATRDVVIQAMRLAEESFAAWPAERPLILRDVAAYLALTEGLKKDIAVSGVHSHAVECMIETVAAEIPADL